MVPCNFPDDGLAGRSIRITQVKNFIVNNRAMVTFVPPKDSFHLLNQIDFSENQVIMKYRIDKQDQYAVLTLDEENLNSTIAPSLKSDLIFFSQEGVRNLILDLSNVKFVDSSGLSAILTGHRLWKDGSSFVIAGHLHPMVTKLIEISRLDTILTLVPTLSEAVDYIKMEELERELQEEE